MLLAADSDGVDSIDERREEMQYIPLVYDNAGRPPSACLN